MIKKIFTEEFQSFWIQEIAATGCSYNFFSFGSYIKLQVSINLSGAENAQW